MRRVLNNFLDRAKKSFLAEDVTSSKRKLNIALDENAEDTLPEIKGLGFTNAWSPIKGTPDPKIHIELNKTKTKFFTTRNTKDFVGIPDRQYVVIDVQRVTKEPIGLAKIIKNFLQQEGHKYQAGSSFVISQETVKRLRLDK